MTEQDYDETIGPQLAEIAQQVVTMGGSMVARVEWAKDEAGITYYGISEHSGIGQRLAGMAVLCRGNLDQLYINAANTFDLSQTLIGRVLGPRLGDGQ